MRLAAGTALAIVGATGSGKTTLAALATGVYKPDAGHVRRALPLDRTVTVPQESHLFADTVRANLTIAAPDATDDEVAKALSVVGASASMDRLPSGVNTRVGAGGHAITPALTQQIALARAYLADPAFLVLDEATADAGASDTARLEDAATRVAHGRTVIVIAHRLTQAAVADTVVVMDQGRIVETGTHDELVSANGAYAQLWEAWSSGSRSSPRRSSYGGGCR